VELVRERAVPERLDGEHRLLAERLGRELDDSAERDALLVDARAVLRRSVELARVAERRPRAARGGRIDPHRVARVRDPWSGELRRVEELELAVVAVALLGGEAPPAACVLDQRA
jgi:hypothetical protein